MAASADRSFLAHFAAINDPRQVGKVLYPLPEILLLLLCATIAGADDFVEIALWGHEHLAFLRQFLLYQRGIPSHDVLCDVIAAIDPEAFKSCFLAWVETLRAKEPAIIAVGGKTSRRSHARGKGRLPLHTVSAWATGQRLVLGQEAVAEKSNEIVAIPALLQRLDLQGALVTIDAMGTQASIAQTIRDGGDYVLALKENWPATHAQVEAMFATPPDGLSIGAARPSTANTAGSRPAAMRSVTMSTGCSPNAGIPASSASLALPPSAWCRARPSVTA
jgi:DDE_Tnp_1-associated/Transposase DDE domain